MDKGCLMSSITKFSLWKPRTKTRRISSRIALRICNKNLERKMILNSKRLRHRKKEKELQIVLPQLQVSSPTQPLSLSWGYKNGQTTTRRRKTWWTCTLEMLTLLRMLSTKSNSKLVSDLLRKLSLPSSKLTSKTTLYTTMLTKSTQKLIWLRSKISRLKRRSRVMKSWES